MRSVLLLFAASLAGVIQGAEMPPLILIQTIPLPGVNGRFDHFAVDTKGQRLFVAALGNNTLEVVDLAAGKRIRSLPRMSKPTGVLYLTESNRILVANGDDGTLRILDGADYRTLQKLTALPDADNLRLDPGTRLAWLGYGEGALAIIDPAAAKLVGSVKLAAHPEAFQLEKAGHRIFVNVPDAKQIAVIDRTQRSVLATWPMKAFQDNFPMALDETDHRLLIGCRKPPALVVFDTVAGKPVTDVTISADTDDLFYDAKRKRVYLSCGAGFIDTIVQETPDTYRRIATLPTAPGARTSFFSPDLDRLYLAVPEHAGRAAEIRVYQTQP